MRDALVIQSNLPKGFNLQKVKAEILPYVTLNKIMTCEYKNGTCCYDKESLEWFCGNDEGDSDDGEDNDGEDKDGEDNDGEDNDGEDDDGEDEDEEDNDNVHPVDNLLDLIHRSDNILRQTIMEKLSLCQVALPLLLPNHSDNTVSYLLWAMRSIVKKWYNSISNKYVESPFVDYSSPVISFLRIGSVNLSKSEVLNHVIGEFEFFFYEGCNRVNCKKKFTEGLVDLCCYLPDSSADNFQLSDDLILFLNLHGDAQRSEKQVNLIKKISVVLFVFVNESNMDDNVIQMIKNLRQEKNKIILVVDNISKQKLKLLDKILYLSFKGTKVKILENHIQEIIAKNVKTRKKVVKLSECSDMARSCGIMVDEDDKDCIEGYKKAKYILDELNACHPTETKLKFFPLQGAEGWKKWAEIDRKQRAEFGKLKSDLEKFNITKNTQKLEIRKRMEHHCNHLSLPVEKFMEVLSRSSSSISTNYIYKHYFLRWLKLLLDKHNRSVFVALTSNDNKCLANEICNAIIGLEHFFREIGQFYETFIYLKRGFQKHSHYPRVMAELIADGYCMEIMDGDSTHVPVEWVSAIFKELQVIYNRSTLCAVSIVGIQSTGKSTLLNTMFGLNFDVSAGRCTRGAFMQLLPFHEDAKKISKCDHLLLIDTEGLRAPELQFIDKHHDNELAAFVIGLADVAIINIGGESQAELSDILQTVCHGLIRIKHIKIDPSCKFVHHHIAEPGAETKISDGKKIFLQLLDANIQKVCEWELCNEYSSFTEFMKCNEEQDILYFSALWHGNPPMAKVNIKYAQNAQNLKQSLINDVGQHKTHSFANFYIKLNTLWNGVLCEQFLFSFKNTLEVIVRKEYDHKHCKWNSELRLVFLEWEYQAKASFHIDESQDTKTRKERLLNEVQEILEKRKNEILEKRDQYFKNSKHRTILAEWETKSNDKIKNYYEEYIEWAKRSIMQLIIEYNSETEASKMMKNIFTKLDAFANDIFVSNPDIRLSKQALEKKFNEKWSAWLDDIPSVKYKTPEEIEHQILQILQEYFKLDWHSLNHKLLKTPLANWSTAFTLNAESHLISKNDSEAKPTNTELFDFVECLVSQWIKKFAYSMESTETQIVYTYQGILYQFDHQISKLLKEFEEAKQKYDFFQFTKECIFDTVLTVSKKTKDLLTSFEEKARINDVKHDLESRKKNYLNILIVSYDNKKKVQEESIEMEKHYKERTLTLKRSLVYEEQRYNLEREKKQKEYEESLEEDKRKYLGQKQTSQTQDTTQLNKSEKEDSKMQEIYQEKSKVPLESDRLLDMHTKVVEYLCDVMGNTVTKALKVSMKLKVYKDITATNPAFESKKNFKLSVLELLLDKDCFEDYKLYFTDPEKSFEKSMYHLVNKHCLDTIDPSKNCNEHRLDTIDPSTNNTKFHMLKESTLQELLEPIQTAIIATNIEDSDNLTFFYWITKFSANVHSRSNNTHLSYDIQSISETNIPWKSSNDANAFKSLFLQQINPTLVKMNSQELYDDIEAELTEYIWNNLKKTLLGCTARCPFCKEMCDCGDVCTKGEQHSIKLHRPQCFSKLLQHNTRCLVVDVCTTSIGSDGKFRNNHTNWKWKPYKKYDSLYPDWYIESTTKSVESYWIWVVTHFAKDIAKWCGKGKTNTIPEEWYKTTKDDAKKCVNLPTKCWCGNSTLRLEERDKTTKCEADECVDLPKDIAKSCSKRKTDSIPEEWYETTKSRANECVDLSEKID